MNHRRWRASYRFARLAAFAIPLALGCGPPTSAAPTPPGGAASVEPTRAALPIAREILTTVCNTLPCGGDGAMVELLRDTDGRVRRLRRSYGGCVHSPAIYFDETGRQTEIIPMQPVVVGSPEQLAFAARIDLQTTGLTSRGETIRCSDGLLMICTEGHGCVVAPNQ